MELNRYDAIREDYDRRLRDYKKAWNAFYNDVPDSLTVKKGQANDNIKVNYSRLVVEKGVAFLFGKDIRFEVEGDEDVIETDVSKAELWLEEVWKANKKGSLLMRLGTKGAVTGTAIVKILPKSAVTGDLPRIVVQDPQDYLMYSSHDDYEDIFKFVIQYEEYDHETRRDVQYRETHERIEGKWYFWEEKVDLKSGATQVIRDRTLWPYDWSPILFCQNLPEPNCIWGLSDLEDDVIGLNGNLNFVLSNIQRIIRYHAHPKTWGRGFAADALEIGPDETILIDSPDAMIDTLEMQSDLSSSTEFARKLKQLLHETTRVPEITTGSVENMGNIAGVALAVMYEPLVEKTNGKRVTYGELLEALCSRLLEIGGFGKNRKVKIHWPDLLPRDSLQERQTAQIDVQLGVSKDTLQSKLGYDPEMERKKKALEPTEPTKPVNIIPDNGNQPIDGGVQ